MVVDYRNNYRWLLALGLSLISSFLWAQSHSLTGRVVDSLQEPMTSVSVVLLEPGDSSLKYFITTDKQGYFLIEGIAAGDYLLQASFIGFGTHYRPLRFAGESSRMDLGEIRMREEVNVLSEVVVEGQRIPIIINRDTVSYQAGAFNVRADENVEDLLRRLPGIDVDADGRVSAQGEEVTKVLVDGKEFFGGNVQIATQNLPADAIERIKFYDRQSERSMYTGVDDGQREKTMDLELKEDRKKGVFGDLAAGGGTDERYQFKAGIHGFNATSRLSLLGNANNLNEYGFSWSDYLDMVSGDGSGGGGMGRAITIQSNTPVPMSFMGPSNGVFSSRSGGLNFNHDPNKKHRFNLTYFYTATDHLLEQNTEGREFNSDRVVGLQENELSELNWGTHSGLLTYRWDADTLNRLELRGGFRFTNRQDEDNQFTERLQESGEIFQRSIRSQESTSENLDYSGRLGYTRLFSKEKRNLNLGIRAQQVRNNVEDIYDAVNSFPLQDREDFLDQLRSLRSLNREYRVDADYTEPISKFHLLSLNSLAERVTYETETEVTDQFSGDFRPLLSPWYFLEREHYLVGPSYSYQPEEGGQISVRLPVNIYRQQARDLRLSENIDPGPWYYFLPSVSWYREAENFGRTRLSYNRSVQLPQLTQWIANPDSLNPLSVRVGNPGLEPEVQNELRFYHHQYSSFNKTSRYISVSGAITENPIISAQRIDSNFTRIIRPVNVSEPRYSVSASGGGRFPLKFLKLFVRPRLSYNYSQVNEPLNDLLNLHRSHGLAPGLTLSNFRSDKLSVSLSGQYSFNWNRYSLQPELDNFFITHRYELDLRYTPNKRLTLRSSFSYRYFSQERFADAAGIPLLESSVAYSFLASRKLTLKLSVFDVLNQNTGLERQAQGNNIYQIRANNLTRYILLSLSWRFTRQ